MKKTVPLQEALAFCFAAQRINGLYLKDTQRYSTEGIPTQHSNKELVKQHFGDYKDPDFVDFKPIEEDYESENSSNFPNIIRFESPSKPTK